MNRTVKRISIGVGALLGAVVVVGAGYAFAQGSAFDESMAKVYPVAIPKLERSTDPEVLARGKHLAEAVAGCLSADCHGADGSGGRPIVLGPIGTVSGPNITPNGMGAVYSEGELSRLIHHAVKKDGRSVRFMPVGEFSWLPESDVLAIVSYVKSLPPVEKANGPVHLGILGKVLDRKNMLPLDIARTIDHDHTEVAPPPAPTAEYGKYLARLCTTCHGARLSGGPIPGAPPDLPVPTNLTPHETGLKDWSFEDFEKLLTTGILKDGRKADPMMPYEDFRKMDDTEKHALYAYLRTVPAVAFGGR